MRANKRRRITADNARNGRTSVASFASPFPWANFLSGVGRDRSDGVPFILKPLFTSPSQKNEKRCDDLRRDAAGGVNEHIAHGGGAAGNEGLVIFVERGVGGDD